MKIQDTTIYRCDFCNKTYFRRASAEKHEKHCFFNPENRRACLNCVHQVKKEVEIYRGYEDPYTGEPLSKLMSFYFCAKKKIFLYPPKSEAKGTHQHLTVDGDNFENHPMPKECSDFSIDQEDLF